MEDNVEEDEKIGEDDIEDALMEDSDHDIF
jgi:hypothetical protein